MGEIDFSPFFYIMEKSKIVRVGDTAYQVGRTIKNSWFKDAIKHHGVNTITDKMGYDRLLRGTDGTYLLVYEIKEADVIEYVEETEEDIQESEEERDQ